MPMTVADREKWDIYERLSKDPIQRKTALLVGDSIVQLRIFFSRKNQQEANFSRESVRIRMSVTIYKELKVNTDNVECETAMLLQPGHYKCM